MNITFFVPSEGKMKMRPRSGSWGNAAVRKSDWLVDIRVARHDAVGSVRLDVSSLPLIVDFIACGKTLHRLIGMHLIEWRC